REFIEQRGAEERAHLGDEVPRRYIESRMHCWEGIARPLYSRIHFIPRIVGEPYKCPHLLGDVLVYTDIILPPILGGSRPYGKIQKASSVRLREVLLKSQSYVVVYARGIDLVHVGSA